MKLAFWSPVLQTVEVDLDCRVWRATAADFDKSRRPLQALANELDEPIKLQTILGDFPEIINPR